MAARQPPNGRKVEPCGQPKWAQPSGRKAATKLAASELAAGSREAATREASRKSGLEASLCARPASRLAQAARLATICHQLFYFYFLFFILISFYFFYGTIINI